MEATRSLDTAEAGETLTVRRILFDTLRSHCSARGVREGARLTVGPGDGERLQLCPVGGQPVPCERRYARFIQVASVVAGQARPLGTTRGEDGDGGARS